MVRCSRGCLLGSLSEVRPLELVDGVTIPTVRKMACFNSAAQRFRAIYLTKNSVCAKTLMMITISVCCLHDPRTAGCQECRRAESAGPESQNRTENFSGWADGLGMKSISRRRRLLLVGAERRPGHMPVSSWLGSLYGNLRIVLASHV